MHKVRKTKPLHTLEHIWFHHKPPQNEEKGLIHELTVNHHKITNNVDISNAFNDYFSTVGEQLVNKINTPNAPYKYLKDPNPYPFILSPTDKFEILQEINKLNPKIAGGHDNVTQKLLRFNQDVLADPITHIINMSFLKCTIPNQLEIAKVIPIFKKNETNCMENYRQISLLPSINKIIEKLMHKRQIHFRNLHKIFYKYQFGFRQNHSNSLALIKITDNTLEDLQNGHFVAGIYLDLSKVVVTADHKIPINKLNHYEIRGKAQEWFSSYLQNHQQFTHLNKTSSDVKSINYGVPQGSVWVHSYFLYTQMIL